MKSDKSERQQNLIKSAQESLQLRSTMVERNIIFQIGHCIQTNLHNILHFS